jgi:hypothetical protein
MSTDDTLSAEQSSWLEHVKVIFGAGQRPSGLRHDFERVSRLWEKVAGLARDVAFEMRVELDRLSEAGPLLERDLEERIEDASAPPDTNQRRQQSTPEPEPYTLPYRLAQGLDAALQEAWSWDPTGPSGVAQLIELSRLEHGAFTVPGSYDPTAETHESTITLAMLARRLSRMANRLALSEGHEGPGRPTNGLRTIAARAWRRGITRSQLARFLAGAGFTDGRHLSEADRRHLWMERLKDHWPRRS